MKKVYTAHPLMILSFIKPFLFVLFLPIIKGIIHYFTNRTITGVIIFEILLLAIVFIIMSIKTHPKETFIAVISIIYIFGINL